jgi:hypothetical protein
MEPERFWDIIAKTHRDDDAQHFQALKEELARLPASDIVAFRKRYEALIEDADLTDLWGAAYLINGGCSDDGFHHFRTWFVGQGCRIYEAALKNPDSLAKVVDGEEICDSNLYCAAYRAWHEKTGRPEEDFYQELAGLDGPPNTRATPQGEDWDSEDDEEVRRHLPQLGRLYFDDRGA